MIETAIYSTLKSLSIPLVPLAPNSDDAQAIGNVELPYIVYRRKGTSPESDLSGARIFETAEIEVLCYGNTNQQATEMADDITDLLDGQTITGHEFTLSNRFLNDGNLSVMHLWFNIFSIVPD